MMCHTPKVILSRKFFWLEQVADQVGWVEDPEISPVLPHKIKLPKRGLTNMDIDWWLGGPRPPPPAL